MLNEEQAKNNHNHFPVHRAAAILGISSSTLVDLVKTNRIRAVENVGDHPLISFEELERFRSHGRGNSWS